MERSQVTGRRSKDHHHELVTCCGRKSKHFQQWETCGQNRVVPGPNLPPFSLKWRQHVFRINPQTKFHPTDLPHREILLSAISAGFKDGPKNSSNVQPVVPLRATVCITAPPIVRKATAIMQNIATAADMSRVGTPTSLEKARRSMRKSTHSPITWPNLSSIRKRTMKYRQDCTRRTVKPNGSRSTRAHSRTRSQQSRLLIVSANSATLDM